MAIQPNRRKRKHQEADGEQQDEGEVEIPKKLAKESDTPKKSKKKNKPEGLLDETTPETNGTESADTTPSKKKVKKPKATQENEEQQVEVEQTESPTKKHKKRKDVQQDEDEISPDSGIEPEETSIRFPNDFKMMHFRTKLRSNNFITGG